MARPFRLPDDPGRAGGDVDREIELHLELRAREFEAQGMTPEEARAAALASFGDRATIARECTDVRSDTLEQRKRIMNRGDWWIDVRSALRGLRRAPGFTLLALLTLGLGVGANAALFTVVRGVLLRPLPYPDADRLVQIWTDERARGRAEPEWLTPPDFADYRRESRTFADMAAYQGWQPDLTERGEPVALSGTSVSASFFGILGASMALGRDFTPADEDPGAERVVILSDALWRGRFGADPAVLGQAMTLTGEPWTIVGVLPRNFRTPTRYGAEVFRPLRFAGTGCGASRDCVVLQAVGRLRPGVSYGAAEEDLDAVAARLANQFPDSNRDRGAWTIPLHEQVTGPVKPALIALFVAVGFVLLVACVNLATLLLVRGAARRREIAVRAALGAGRGRVVRQLMVESLVLALIGGVIGLLVAVGVSGAVSSLVPQAVRSVQQVGVDLWVIGFSVAAASLCGVLIGVLPAFQAVSGDTFLSLRSGQRTEARGGGRLRDTLVVAQLALAVVLLTGAGLLLRSLVELQRVDLGFRTEGLLDATVAFPRTRYADGDRVRVAVEDLLSRLRAHPAIKSAEVTDLPPLTAGDQDIGLAPVGEPTQSDLPGLWYRSVTPGYLDLMEMKLVRGRGFQPGDDRDGTLPVIVNEETARRLWRGGDPIGRELAGDGNRAVVIGIVTNGRHDGPNRPYKTEMFLPYGRVPARAVSVMLEPAAGPVPALEAFREALKAVDPLIPVASAEPLAARLDGAVELPRLYALLVAGFAAAALGLAALGVFGVMAYAVTLRRRELGVRLALGAAPRSLRAMILGRGTMLALAGVGIGLAGAFLVSRFLGALMFGVSATDPVTYLSVAVLLAAVTVAAAWVPASRAMRVDPLVTMRDE